MYGDNLSFEVELTISGKKYTYPGGTVERCELDLQAYGFSGSLTFYTMLDLIDTKLFDKLLQHSRQARQGVVLLISARGVSVYGKVNRNAPRMRLQLLNSLAPQEGIYPNTVDKESNPALATMRICVNIAYFTIR